MDYFGDYVYLARNKEDYPGLIEQAISENNPEKEKQRIALARSHSWKNFVEKIYMQIDLLLNK